MSETTLLLSLKATVVENLQLEIIFASLCSLGRDVFEDAMVEAKARSFRIKATYAYEILHD